MTAKQLLTGLQEFLKTHPNLAGDTVLVRTFKA